MSNVRVTREDMIEQSVLILAKASLLARGYTSNDFTLMESFPYKVEKFDKNIVACGFTFDDGGKAAELGSNMKERKHTIEFFVFGTTNTFGRSLANALKFSLEQDLIIPLLDITQAGNPEIDVLYVDAVHSRRQPVPDPAPFQEFTWYTVVQVTDYYTPNLT